MFNISNLLNSIDNAAKETLEEPKVSATSIRMQRRGDDEGDGEDPRESLSHLERVASVDDDSHQVRSPQSAGDYSNAQGIFSDASEIVGNSAGSDVENELKRAIKKKNKEIEQLNTECLELEDQCKNLKVEVKEAWDSYRIAQEKAAAREAELQDEMKQMQKAKSTDKQQLQAHMTRMNEEATEFMKQKKQIEAERDAALDRLRDMEIASRGWLEEQAKLTAQLSDARVGSIQGGQELRDQLQAAEEASKLMRLEHASLLRQNQIRQAELEKENSLMTSSLAEKEKEFMRLHMQLQQAGKADGANRELEGLREQVDTMAAQLEEERNRYAAVDKKMRQMDCEYRAATICWDDERQRAGEVVSELQTRIGFLEDKLKEALSARKESMTLQEKRRLFGPGGLGEPNGDDGSTDSARDSHRYESEVRDWAEQVQNLSKQLLKKQALVQELQAERAALKSRLMDLQARCDRAEQQLLSVRDLEGDDMDDDYSSTDNLATADGSSGNASEYGGSHFPRSSGTGLQRRGSGSGGSSGGSSGSRGGLKRRSRQEHMVISDLEKIGVRAGPGVTKAVDMIDTWTLVTGRFLRSYPLVRLAFVLYLLILHLWVLLVLAMHTHSLEVDTEPQHQVLNVHNR